MKKIGIDARLYAQTGVGTYIKNLLHELAKKKDSGVVYYIYLMKNEYNTVNFNNKNFVKKLANFKWHGVGEQVFFALKLYWDNLDLMHFTYFGYPVIYLKRFISTVHDITPLQFKTGTASTKNAVLYKLKYLVFKFVLKTQVSKSLKILTPTNTVKKQLVKYYGTKINTKIIVTYEGVNYLIKKTKINNSLINTYKDFFIYVGNFYPHKNVERLIEAFSKVKTNTKLLLIGPNDFFTTRIISKIDSKKIFLIENPPLSDLAFFYKNAKAIIHPSLSEGFGLPLIEAAYFDCPIIASKITVFNELLGKNYISFNPTDSIDIKNKIENFIKLKNKFDYSKLLNKCSFKKMADCTYSTYKGLL